MEAEKDRLYYAELVRSHNEKIFEETGRQPEGYIRTFGCQQNVSDSEKLKGMLAEMGYALADGPQGADIILFNTCAVRENAEDRVLGNVGALKAAKEQNRKLIIGLCGCMMQQPHITATIREHYPYVDLVFGTHAIGRFPYLVWSKLSRGGHVTDIGQAGADELGEDLPTRRDGNTRAWVPIMYGCDNFCTYCVVPYVRGRERSRQPRNIIKEVQELVAGGYKEFTLLGQNVNSYGKTLEPAVGFSSLLRELNRIPGKFRIRFMTSHPKDCTRELIDAVAECEKVCKHIHLPVQSGSDRILAAMNRGYSAKDYLDLIGYARKRIPGVAFTSDIIVGFPGESAEDFAATLSLVEQVRYHSLFTFIYSKREGTGAAELDDPTSRQDKMARFESLLALQRGIGREYHEKIVGGTVRVLVEGPGKTGPDRLTGRNDQNVIVEFDGDSSMIGSFVDIRVTEALQWAVVGEPAG